MQHDLTLFFFHLRTDNELDKNNYEMSLNSLLDGWSVLGTLFPHTSRLWSFIFLFHTSRILNFSFSFFFRLVILAVGDAGLTSQNPNLSDLKECATKVFEKYINMRLTVAKMELGEENTDLNPPIFKDQVTFLS